MTPEKPLRKAAVQANVELETILHTNNRFTLESAKHLLMEEGTPFDVWEGEDNCSGASTAPSYRIVVPHDFAKDGQALTALIDPGTHPEEVDRAQAAQADQTSKS